jgi:hypothetical protein
LEFITPHYLFQPCRVVIGADNHGYFHTEVLADILSQTYYP